MKNSAIDGIAARKKGLVSSERVLLRAGVITGKGVTSLQSYVKESLVNTSCSKVLNKESKVLYQAVTA
jgi:hypothetical protein